MLKDIRQTKRTPQGIQLPKNGHFAIIIDAKDYTDGDASALACQAGWTELRKDTRRRIGTVVSKKIGTRTYHAMVCYDTGRPIDKRWNQSPSWLTRCLNKIDTLNGTVLHLLDIRSGRVHDGAVSCEDEINFMRAMIHSRQLVIYHRF